MNTTVAALDLRLAHQAMFRVPDAAGVEIVCRSGSIWITLDNDPRDIVLEASDSFTALEHRAALIYAMESSRVSVAGTAQPIPR